MAARLSAFSKAKLMWFWPVNEMTELVSGMPAPQCGDESSRTRGSELHQCSSGFYFPFLIDVTMFSSIPYDVHTESKFDVSETILQQSSTHQGQYRIGASISVDCRHTLDIFFAFPPRPERFWEPPNLLANGQLVYINECINAYK
jgi:hypothetical protein